MAVLLQLTLPLTAEKWKQAGYKTDGKQVVHNFLLEKVFQTLQWWRCSRSRREENNNIINVFFICMALLMTLLRRRNNDLLK